MLFSDGVIRVFTTKPERMAPTDEQKSFEEQVAASAIPKQLGDVKLEELPGPEVLLNPGTAIYYYSLQSQQQTANDTLRYQ